MRNLVSCILDGRRRRRISIEDHELHRGTDVNEWTDKIRILFEHAKLTWSDANKMVVRDVYGMYHHRIPFHNHTHVYDVLQMGVFLLVSCKAVFRKLSYDQRFTFCIALLCHDIDHRGYTNSDIEKDSSVLACMDDDTRSERSTSSDLSLSSYCSSQSHNEKHHISKAGIILKRHGVTYDKHLFASLIAHTDLSRHQTFVDNMMNFDEQRSDIHNQLILLMKLADIGHILRPWNKHVYFVHAMNQERINPKDVCELPEDTLKFNEMFVYALICLIHKIDTPLYESLVTKFETNKEIWNKINDLYGVNLCRDIDPN